MWQLVLGLGVANLVTGAAAWYYSTRARGDRAERDAAMTRAAGASDLASRLQAALDAVAKAARDDDKQALVQAGHVRNSDDAARFLGGSTVGTTVRVLSSPAAGGAPGGLPAAPTPGPSGPVAGVVR